MIQKPLQLVAALTTACALAMPAFAQTGNASGGAKAATVNGVAIPKARVDAIIRSQNQPDSEQLRQAVTEKLIELETLAQEAQKKGLAKNPDVIQALEFQKQQILAQALVADFLKNAQVSDDAARAEYERVKSQMGPTEYKVKHILVGSEAEAQDAIKRLQGGASFADIAKAVSKDPGSKERGGDLDWQSPAGYVKPFSDAMVKLQKGQYTQVPVQSQFGWHVIMLEDTRPTKVPSFDEVKNEVKQRLQQQQVQKYVQDLRAKATVTQ
jgi:peptidyl-prolyl cis-trans isomerase C